MAVNTYYYGLDDDNISKKINNNSWINESLPDSPTILKDIHGTSLLNIWTVGRLSANQAYVANNRSGSWVRDTTHPLDGLDWNIQKVFVYSDNETWTQAQYNVGAGFDVKIHRWTNGVGWEEMYSNSNSFAWTPRCLEKIGNYIALWGEDRIFYSSNNGLTWQTDSQYFGVSVTNGDLIANQNENNFYVVAFKNYGAGYSTLRLYKGLPPTSWTFVAEYDPGSSVSLPSNTHSVLWADTDGNPFVLLASPSPSMLYDLLLTPTAVSTNANSMSIYGVSSTDVFWFINESSSLIQTWNGSGVSTEATLLENEVGSSYGLVEVVTTTPTYDINSVIPDDNTINVNENAVIRIDIYDSVLAVDPSSIQGWINGVKVYDGNTGFISEYDGPLSEVIAKTVDGYDGYGIIIDKIGSYKSGESVSVVIDAVSS